MRIRDDDLWIRRTAVLSQIRHRGQTDAETLFRHCLDRAHERDFFMRKAIGWALREYSKAEPDGVLAFLREHRSVLSGLSFREGAKVLKRAGVEV